jgi:DNA-binding PucR family transcriptional regulator
MFAGIGLPAAALAGVSRSHEEAQRALLHTDPERPVRALADVPLFDDLLAGADAMVRSRLPTWVATLRTEDASGELLATLRALLDAGNSAAKAAKVLGVHVNTVRYRMQRLATITGSDLGDFRQLADVVVALRLAGPRWL